jgi:hypothetical protein
MSDWQDIETAMQLTDEEVVLVERAVRALVDRDEGALAQMGAYDDGADPYLWTRDYGTWPEVELVIPPGPVRRWSVSGIRNQDEGRVEVDMWTVQEGESDLTLSLRLRPAEGFVRIDDLHVL